VIDDLVDRLRLVRSPGIGPVTYRQLIARFGWAKAALDAVPDLAARGGGKAPRLVSRADAEREIARVEALGARYLVLVRGLYPRALAELDDAPPLLTAKGDVRLLDKPLVAIVGARNAFGGRLPLRAPACLRSRPARCGRRVRPCARDRQRGP
jgi:DNA processing protein